MVRINYFYFYIIFILFLSNFFITPGSAYTIDKITPAPKVNKVLQVGVIPLTPFVIEEDGKHKGISIELWEKIAGMHGWNYKYTSLHESGYLDVEPLLEQHNLDLVIGPLAITYERIDNIAFSTPYYITTSNLITKNTDTSFF